MKGYIFLFLFAIAFCQKDIIVVEPERDLDKRAADLAKCIINGIFDLKPEIFELIDAIESKDKGLIFACLIKIAGKGAQIYIDCFKKNFGDFNLDWKKFGMCILSKIQYQHVPAYLKELVNAIKSKNWGKVAQLALSLIAKGVPVVIECYNSSK